MMSHKVTVLFVLMMYFQLFHHSSCSESVAETETMLLLRELSGAHLRFSAYPDPPNLSEHEEFNGTFTYTGFIKSIADSMAEILNITYTFVRVPKAEVDKFGVLQASINMLMRNEIDVVTRVMGLGLEYYTRMDCSLPLYFLVKLCAQQEAKNGFWKVLGDVWREYPDLLFTDRQKGFEMLFTGHQHAYVGTDGRVAYFMDMAFKRAKGNCELTVSNYSIGRQFSFVWTFPKHWRYTNAVNHKLKWWPESGLMKYWHYSNQILRGIEECRLPVDRVISSTNGDDRKVLTLENLSGPFLFLIFGISVSFLVFLLEIIYYNYKKHRTSP